MLKLTTKSYKLKVRASTLIETVVSLTILLTILGLFFGGLGKIELSTNPYRIRKTFEISQTVLLSDDLLLDDKEETLIEDLKVIKKVEEDSGVFYIEIEVYDKNNRLLYKRDKIISQGIEL